MDSVQDFREGEYTYRCILTNDYDSSVRESHCEVRGYCRQKWVLQVQIICKFSNERMCTRKKDVERLSCGFEAILY